jgi:hypothetical protein
MQLTDTQDDTTGDRKMWVSTEFIRREEGIPLYVGDSKHVILQLIRYVKVLGLSNSNKSRSRKENCISVALPSDPYSNSIAASWNGSNFVSSFNQGYNMK